VKDNRDRSILKIRDRKGHGVKAITGNIILERQGRRETISILAEEAGVYGVKSEYRSR